MNDITRQLLDTARVLRDKASEIETLALGTSIDLMSYREWLLLQDGFTEALMAVEDAVVGAEEAVVDVQEPAESSRSAYPRDDDVYRPYGEAAGYLDSPE